MDQFTKYVATAKLEGKAPFVIIEGVFEFNFLEGGNSGAAWALCQTNNLYCYNIDCMFTNYISIITLENLLK